MEKKTHTHLPLICPPSKNASTHARTFVSSSVIAATLYGLETVREKEDTANWVGAGAVAGGITSLLSGTSSIHSFISSRICSCDCGLSPCGKHGSTRHSDTLKPPNAFFF